MISIRLDDINAIIKKMSPEIEDNKRLDINEYYKFRNGALRFYRKIEREIAKLPEKEQAKLEQVCKNSKMNLDILTVNHLERALGSLSRGVDAARGDKREYYRIHKTNMTLDFVKINNVIQNLLNEVPPIDESLLKKCEELKKSLDSMKIRADLENVMQDVEDIQKETETIIHDSELKAMFEAVDEIDKEDFKRNK